MILSAGRTGAEFSRNGTAISTGTIVHDAHVGVRTVVEALNQGRSTGGIAGEAAVDAGIESAHIVAAPVVTTDVETGPAVATETLRISAGMTAKFSAGVQLAIPIPKLSSCSLVVCGDGGRAVKRITVHARFIG